MSETAGTPPIHICIYINGERLAEIVTKHQQKRARRNPTQRRGPKAAGE